MREAVLTGRGSLFLQRQLRRRIGRLRLRAEADGRAPRARAYRVDSSHPKEALAAGREACGAARHPDGPLSSGAGRAGADEPRRLGGGGGAAGGGGGEEDGGVVDAEDSRRSRASMWLRLKREACF